MTLADMDRLVEKLKGRIRELEATNTRLKEEVEQARDDGASMARDNLNAAREELARAVAANTPLRERVAALEKQLSEGVGLLRIVRGEITGALAHFMDGTDGAHHIDWLGPHLDKLLLPVPAVTGTTSDKPPICQLDGRCTAWTREGGERCLNSAAPGKSLCAEPHRFGEPDPELDELLDEIGSGLGCTPYLDGGAIRKAEEALSKVRARLTPAGGT